MDIDTMIENIIDNFSRLGYLKQGYKIECRPSARNNTDNIIIFSDKMPMPTSFQPEILYDYMLNDNATISDLISFMMKDVNTRENAYPSDEVLLENTNKGNFYFICIDEYNSNIVKENIDTVYWDGDGATIFLSVTIPSNTDNGLIVILPKDIIDKSNFKDSADIELYNLALEKMRLRICTVVLEDYLDAKTNKRISITISDLSCTAAGFYLIDSNFLDTVCKDFGCSEIIVLPEAFDTVSIINKDYIDIFEDLINDIREYINHMYIMRIYEYSSKTKSITVYEE